MKIVTKIILVVLFIFSATGWVNAATSMETFARFSSNWLANDCVAPDWCDSLDANIDGTVNLDDFLVFLDDWLGEEDLANIVWVSVDTDGFSGEISKYETTNLQYVAFLNEQVDSGLIVVHANGNVYSADDTNCSTAYIATSTASQYSQILYSNGQFSGVTRDGFDMSNHPVTSVTWYGAKAFCSYYGYSLPTESQWEAIADYEGNHYACGDIINSTLANYNLNNPLGLTYQPYTTPVNFYPSYGYGVNDMAGNVWEWTDTVLESNPDSRVTKGGGWAGDYYFCSIAGSKSITASCCGEALGFRVCR